MTRRKGERLILLRREGIFWSLWNLRRRPLLFAGMVWMLVLALWLPGRVLFVEVEGNENVSEQLILEAAQEAGISFGAYRRAVRSEKMKNELLGTLPELQWAGVNTYGCRAVISVRERVMQNEQSAIPAVSSIVAACDGVITSSTVTRGTGLCSVGQAVQKGQVLISGYVDHGLAVTATRAEGEIFAQTQHNLDVIMPATNLVRDAFTGRRVNYSLLIGKKRINLWKGSGISDGSCVKMVSQYHLALPGNFELPLVLLKEETHTYQLERSQSDGREEREQLSDFSKTLIKTDAIALTITDEKECVDKKDGLLLLKGIYGCTEMIGREQGVQIGDFHGKTD